MSSSIRKLSSKIINKISAGEVILSPVNVVKELLENSIDALSTQVDIYIEQGGRNLVKVIDDGIGIAKEDLPLVIEQHATSKLKDDDIFAVASMGFRGEAMHSISTVSRLSITSRSCSEEYAWSMVKDGENAMILSPASLKNGTVVEVRDLFFSMPTRIKFLKNKNSEVQSIIEIINKLSLCNPNIGFRLISDGKKVLDYKKSVDYEEKILHMQIFGSNFLNNFHHGKFANDSGYSVEIFASKPTYNGAQSNFYVFVNNRIVFDQTINSAIKAAYYDYIPKSRFPTVVIFFFLPFNEVDINIHPTKNAVKFLNPHHVKRFIFSNIIKVIASNDFCKIAKEDINNGLNKDNNSIIDAIRVNNEKINLDLNDNKDLSYTQSFKDFRSLCDDEKKNQCLHHSDEKNHFSEPGSEFKNNKLNATINFQEVNQKSKDNVDVGSSFRINSVSGAEKTECIKQDVLINFGKSSINDCFDMDNSDVDDLLLLKKKKFVQNEFFFKKDYIIKCQIFGTYIVAEKTDEIIVVDQHAAHERLIYERLKKGMNSESQMLLISQVVELNLDEIDILEQNKKLLDAIGLGIQKFGKTFIVVQSIPALLRDFDVISLIKDIVSNDFLVDRNLQQQMERVYATLSCKNAIKANMPLSEDMMYALLDDIEKTDFSAQCNHGRPTYVKIAKCDIEKIFKRS